MSFLGRGDDVFKSSDYRISPFELESVLLEHDAVAEAAVVASPDALRLAVPKAFIVLRPGVEESRDVAQSIFAFCRSALAPYKRIRRLEFAVLPKTISGKIRRVELRQREAARVASGQRGPSEFWSDDV
jgi:acetyl-CoA synthetase